MKRRLVVLLVVALGVVVAAPASANATLSVTYKCNGSPFCHDVWFTSPVFLDWTVTDATSWSPGCVDETIKDDTIGVQKVCTAYNGQSKFEVPLTIKLDQKPPTVSLSPERPPDHEGWYTRPVTFSIQAADETSGPGGCDPLGFSGPDSATAVAVANCRDKAGNVGSRSFPLRYDATPPDPSVITAATGDRVVRLSWQTGATAKLVRTPGIDGSARAVLYDGPGAGFTDRKVRNGRKYRYVLTLTDQAGNSASRELAAIPDRHLVAPAKRATVAGPPRLTWTPVRGARYYNVQLFRNGRKILSEWPRQASLQLKSKWRFHGKRYRLKPGKYRWYVWPGEGPRAENRYGRMVGKRSFTIAPS